MKRVIKAMLGAMLALLPRPQHPQYLTNGLHLRWRLGWLWARWCLLYYRLRALGGGTRLIVGRRFAVQGGLRLRGGGRVIFGDDVIIGTRTDIFTHEPAAIVRVGARSFLNGTRISAMQRIRIKNNVWIAAGAAVLKGVTIGENSVIGFGSVVVKDIPANVIASGNPCQEIAPVTV